MKDLRKLIIGEPISMDKSDHERFMEYYIYFKNANLRSGQSYMNALYQTRPDIYDEVMGCSIRDCFYDDSNINNLLNYLNDREWKT